MRSQCKGMLILVTGAQLSNRISVDKNKETHTAQICQLLSLQLQNKLSDKHISAKCNTLKQKAACIVMQGKEMQEFKIIVYNLCNGRRVNLRISSPEWFYNFHSRCLPQHVNLSGEPSPPLDHNRHSH